MTKEQAIELCRQMSEGSSFYGMLAHEPKLLYFHTMMGEEDKEGNLSRWATVLRKLADALDPKPPVFVTGMSEAKDVPRVERASPPGHQWAKSDGERV